MSTTWPLRAACAAAAVLALGACNRSADTGANNQTTAESRGTSGSRGTTGESSASVPTGTSGTADRTGANAPTGSVGALGSSGGVGPAGGDAGVGRSPRADTAGDNNSATAAPGTAGTLGITANGLPRTQDDRRAASGPAGNTAAGMAGATPSAQLTSGDSKFLVKAALEGMFEVQASQLAASRAAASEIKSFATMLVNDHTNSNNELNQIAGVRGVTVPNQLPQDLQAQLRKLSQGSSTAFDRDYLQQVGVKAHEKDIAEFEDASKSVDDEQLKAWIEKTLPTLRQHLAEAQKLSKRG